MRATADEELEPGLVAVAAPVYRDGAAVVAALSVSAPATRLPAAMFAEVAAKCMAEANPTTSATIGVSSGWSATPASKPRRGRGRDVRPGADRYRRWRTVASSARQSQCSRSRNYLQIPRIRLPHPIG
jgi:hypothetical protein